MSLISVVVPVHNEEESLPLFYERLCSTFKDFSHSVEFIFVDDGSTDESPAILHEYVKQDARVRVLLLSKNFGQWPAITAGLSKARGDAAAWISSDLQDPPEVILEMLKKWESGAKVVWGVRSERDDPWARKLMAKLFYKLLRRVALPKYPVMGTDLCLMDQVILKLFQGLDERSRFTQGLIMNLGYVQEHVEYRRQSRVAGKSKWNEVDKLIDMAMDMMVNFSGRPLRWMLYLGLFSILISGGLLAFALISRLVFNAAVSGWASLMLVVSFFGGVSAFMLGVLGEYIWRILAETKRRPLYIIMDEWEQTEAGATSNAGTVESEDH